MSEQARDQKNTAGAVVAFFAGAAFGAGMALLFAPKSGDRVREAIRDIADDALERVRDYASEAQEKLTEAVEEGLGKLKEKKSILASALEAGRSAMASERDKEQ